MSSERVTKGFAWNHLYKTVEYGLVNLYAILVVRKFGPQLAGGYAVYLSISGTLAILSAFGVDGALLRFLPRVARGEREIGNAKLEGVRPFLFELFAFRMLIAIVIASLVALVLGVLPHYSTGLSEGLGSLRLLWPYLAIFVVAQSAVSFGTFSLLSLLQVKWVFFASLITRVLLLSAGLAAVLLSHLTLEYAVGFHALAAVLNALLVLYWANKYVAKEESRSTRRDLASVGKYFLNFLRRPSTLRLYLVLPFVMYGITTWGSDLLSTVLGRQPDILMMRAMLGERTTQIGLYQSAAQLVLMTEYIFLFGFGGTLVSVFSEMAQEDEANGGGAGKGYTRLAKARRDVAGFQSITTAPLFAFMLVFAPLVVQMLYGYQFAAAAPVVVAGLSILAFTVVVFGGGMQVTSLVVIGKERLVFKNRLCWGLFNLVLNYFLIGQYGATGAMIGTQLCNAGACATESYFASRFIGHSFILRRTSMIVGISAASLALTYFIISLVPSLPTIPRFGLAAACAATFTLCGYFIARVPDAVRVYERLRDVVLQRKKLAHS